jgi:hypothetical protein
MTEPNPIDRVVSQLARLTDDQLSRVAGPDARETLFQEILRTPGSSEAPAPRRTRTIALLTAAVLVLGGAATYAGGQWLSPDEQLSAMDRLTQDIPLPPDGNFDAVRTGIIRAQPQQEESGLAGALAFAATCQWYGYWLDGYNRGDGTQMSAALTTIDEIPSWPQLVRVGSGPGSTVDALKELAQTTDRGDPDPVRQFLTANCSAEPWADSADG